MRTLLAAVLLAALGALAAAVPAAAETVWLCRPGMQDDPCELDLRTTVREQGRAERVEDPPRPAQDERPIDCFYVYPTVSNQRSQNATKARDPELVSIARYQAARFSQHCRVFAPIYRQGTLLALATASEAQQVEIRRTAFADVQEAWREYLQRDNGGRGVVLVGHSQGTRMLRQLVRTDIDPDAAVRRRLVSALLIGGNLTVRRGETTGGDFATVPLCTEPEQFGCAIGFSTFAEDPPSNSRYGRVDQGGQEPFGFPTGPDFEVACTDPAPLARADGPLRLLVPSEEFAPGPIAAGIVVTGGGPPPSAPTPWVVPPDRFTGACARINGAHVLRYEPTPGSRRPNPFPDPTWGTHLIDVNLTLDRLVEIVRLQSERFRTPRLRLTRRCVGRGRLRLRVEGPDAGIVRDVRFTVDRRVVGRDRSAPFERVLTRQVLARRRPRGTGLRLRATAGLTAGAREQVRLERTLPHCGLR